MMLLNGNTAARVRNSEGCTVVLPPCGCAHTDTVWLQMCDAHWEGYRVLHLEGQAAHAPLPVATGGVE